MAYFKRKDHEYFATALEEQQFVSRVMCLWMKECIRIQTIMRDNLVIDAEHRKTKRAKNRIGVEVTMRSVVIGQLEDLVKQHQTMIEFCREEYHDLLKELTVRVTCNAYREDIRAWTDENRANNGSLVLWINEWPTSGADSTFPFTMLPEVLEGASILWFPSEQAAMTFKLRYFDSKDA